ncbi:MAG: glutathione S-transferase C-terminal domain-containing protein, partial [Deltaproteobacteria bacterium]|nr:glutathione S-transferase C-terminal domain-containing protein [Deltaproteobacteria bacterium]
AKDPSQKKSLVNAMHTLLGMFEDQLIKDQSGPFWFGPMLTLTDIAIYPWFERWPVLEHYCNLKIPAERAALFNWIEVMQARPTVREGSQSAKFYIAEYAEYVAS